MAGSWSSISRRNDRAEKAIRRAFSTGIRPRRLTRDSGWMYVLVWRLLGQSVEDSAGAKGLEVRSHLAGPLSKCGSCRANSAWRGFVFDSTLSFAGHYDRRTVGRSDRRGAANSESQIFSR